MGIVLIVISLGIFVLGQFLAGLTNESQEALLFTLPILNFAVLGFSMTVADNSSEKSLHKILFLLILINSLCLLGFAVLMTISALIEGVNIARKSGAIVMYFAYLIAVFLITFWHPYQKGMR